MPHNLVTQFSSYFVSYTPWDPGTLLVTHLETLEPCKKDKLIHDIQEMMFKFDIKVVNWLAIYV